MLSILSVVSLASFAWAADLYVSASGSDSNSGTQSAPFRTIAKASQVAQPGHVVHVAPGTYTGSFATSASGTSSAPITYLSDSKWGAKIVPPSSGSGTAWDVGGDYVVVDGFEIDGQSSTLWQIGIWISGSHTVIKNMNIHHVHGSSCSSNGGAGIGADGYNGQGYHDILNNVVHHIGPGAPGSCGSFNGIYMESHDWTAKNNLAYQNTGDGLTAYHDSVRGQFINNTSFQNGRGIVCSGDGFYHLSEGGPCIIENNIVYDNNPTGSNYTGGIGVSGSLTAGSVVANNFVANNQGVALGLGSGVSESNNITSGSPGFVNYQASGSGDYHLTSSSQLIDQGLSTYAPKNDLDGGARSRGAGYDIGAYEYGAAPAPSPSPIASMTVSTTQVAPGGTITVNISGVGQSTEEYVALYLSTAADLDWAYKSNWMYLNGSQTQPSAPISSATLKFVAPMEAGTYNIRLFGAGNASNRLATSSDIKVVVVSVADKVAPSTNITSPANGSIVARGSNVAIAASASDNVGVSKVEFYVNGNLRCTDTVAPYNCNITASTRRGVQYNLQTKAYDAAGNVGSSAIAVIKTSR